MKALRDEFTWLEKECQNIQFGSINFNAVIHNGKIVRVERSITTKSQFNGNLETK